METNAFIRVMRPPTKRTVHIRIIKIGKWGWKM